MRSLIAANQRQAILESLPPNGTMLEWGAGGSTIWFLDHLQPGQSLFTIEHDDAWLVQTEGAAGKRTNWRPLLKRAMLPVGQNATPWEECPAGLADYIVPLPKAVLETVDVFLVDGVARGACLATVAMYAKPDAVAWLHDLHRNWYDWILGAPRFHDQHILEASHGDYPPPLWGVKVR